MFNISYPLGVLWTKIGIAYVSSKWKIYVIIIKISCLDIQKISIINSSPMFLPITWHVIPPIIKLVILVWIIFTYVSFKHGIKTIFFLHWTMYLYLIGPAWTSQPKCKATKTDILGKYNASWVLMHLVFLWWNFCHSMHFFQTNNILSNIPLQKNHKTFPKFCHVSTHELKQVARI
jgi:hypothetical protein